MNLLFFRSGLLKSAGRRRLAARAWCLPALLLAMVSAHAAPPKFEDMGTFTGRGWGMSSVVGPGTGDSERLYVSYTYPASMDIVAYNAQRGISQTWQHSESGAWAMAVGPDERIYVGTYNRGHILRLDPKSGQLTDLGQVDPDFKGFQIVWGLSVGPDGMIYGGASPNAQLFRIDPADGKIVDLGSMDPTQTYLRSLCAAPDGWVYGGIGSAKAGIVAYHPRTQERRHLIPEAERKPGFGTVTCGKDGHAYGTISGAHYRLGDGQAAPIEKLPEAKSSTLWKSGRTAYPGTAYTGRELGLFRVGAGPDGNVYASSIFPEYLLRFDPDSRQKANLGQLPGAQAYSMLAARGNLYIGSYSKATLEIYDPSQPAKPGWSRQSNPAFYGTVAPNQEHPYDMTLGPDGKIYVACLPSPGHYGGALAWYDPQSDSLGHVPSPVTDQGIASLCTLPNDLLAGGSSAMGGAGTTPRAKDARLFLWNPTERKKVFEGVPVPGMAVIGNLERGGDGLIYGSAGASGSAGSVIFAFDPKTRQVVGQTKLSQGAVPRAGLVALKDGRIVALAGSSAVLIQYAGGEWQTQEIARWGALITAGKAVVGDWLYAAGSDGHLIRCRIPQND